MIIIHIDDAKVQDRLRRLVRRCEDVRLSAGQAGPALQDIGESLLASTKERFACGTAPDGTPWAANTQTTLENYLDNRGRQRDKRTGQRGQWKKGWRKKDGGLGASATTALARKRPLIGESRRQAQQIAVRVGQKEVAVGSSLVR